MGHPLQPAQFDAAEAYRQTLISDDGDGDDTTPLMRALASERKQGNLGAVTGRINYGGND